MNKNKETSSTSQYTWYFNKYERIKEDNVIQLNNINNIQFKLINMSSRLLFQYYYRF